MKWIVLVLCCKGTFIVLCPLATEHNTSNKSDEAMTLEKLNPFTRINDSLNLLQSTY